MSPTISLVVPCYNVEAYVEESLRTAMNQTFDDIEIICVNDGATDSTPDILRRLAAEDARIRIIDKPNTGYGNSMNIGFDAAVGDYLAIFEPDDLMEPEMLEVLHHIALDTGADVVKSNYYYYYSKPEPRDVFCDQLRPEECNHVFRPLDETRIFFVQPSIWSMIYRTDFIRNNNIRFNETPGASYQDASFNFEVWLRAERVYLVHDALIHYRQDNEASSVNNPGKVFCVCDEYERIYATIDALGDPELERRLRVMLSPRKMSTYYWNYKRLAPDLGLQFLYRVQEEYREHEARGEIDWENFPETRPELKELARMVIDDPLLYHLTHTDDSTESNAWRTLKRYYRAGGLPYVLKLIRWKL